MVVVLPRKHAAHYLDDQTCKKNSGQVDTNENLIGNWTISITRRASSSKLASPLFVIYPADRVKLRLFVNWVEVVISDL